MVQWQNRKVICHKVTREYWWWVRVNPSHGSSILLVRLAGLGIMFKDVFLIFYVEWNCGVQGKSRGCSHQ